MSTALRPVLVAAAAAGLCGCATAGSILRQPLDRGDVLHYPIPPESAASVVGFAVKLAGLDVVEETHPDSLTWFAVASAGPSFSLFGGWRFGEIVRVTVRSEAEDLVAVRALSRHRDRTGLTEGRDWTGPVYSAFERLVGRSAVPVPGTRVRLAMPNRTGNLVTGTVLAVQGDTLVLEEGRRVALASLHRLDLGRGTRTHARTGAAIGWVVGGLIGAFVGLKAQERCESSSDVFGPTLCFQGLFGLVLGTTAGTVAGVVVGASVRTDAWWPARPGRLMQR